MQANRVRIRHALVLLALTASASSAALAQRVTNQGARQSKPGEYSGAIGVVADSINMQPLVGATILIEGTTLAAQSASNGEFQFDSIPPGTRRFLVKHPLADSLGFDIVSSSIELPPGRVAVVALALPSASTLRQVLCAVRDTASNFGMIRGRIVAADTDSALAGVRVTFLYHEIRLSADSGMRQLERLRETTTERDGSYTICGLPANVTGTLVAELGSVSSPNVPIARGTGDIVFRNIALGIQAVVSLGSPEASAVRDTSEVPGVQLDSLPWGILYEAGRAVLHGRVIGEDGSGIAEAQVAVAGTSEIATTQTDGSFALHGLPSGTSEIMARKIGFLPASAIMDLTASQPSQVTLTMSRAPPVALDPVRIVRTMRERLQRVGFLDRRRMGIGRFIDADEIERRQPMQVTDIIKYFPGFRIVESEFGRSVVPTRAMQGQSGYCLNLFIDHARWDIQGPGDLDRAFQVNEVAAVEAYAGDFVPQEFTVPARYCPTIVVWTKQKLDER